MRVEGEFVNIFFSIDELVYIFRFCNNLAQGLVLLWT